MASREKHWNWKGGISITTHGYILIQKPSHISADKDGYIRRSHWVWEQHTGKIIDVKQFCIHHKNGIRTDDRIENLEKMTTANHTKIHMSGKKINKETRKKMSMSAKQKGFQKGYIPWNKGKTKTNY